MVSLIEADISLESLTGTVVEGGMSKESTNKIEYVEDES